MRVIRSIICAVGADLPTVALIRSMPCPSSVAASYPRAGAGESGGGGGKHRRGWLAVALAPMQPLCFAVGVRACAFD